MNQYLFDELREIDDIFDEVAAEMNRDSEGEVTPEDIDNEARRRFKINGIDKLNWTLRKMAALEARKQEVDKLAKEEIERITEWKKRQLESVERSAEFFKGLIAEYMDERRKKDPKYKSESTPYGRIGFRKQQPKFEYVNEAATAEWMEKNGHGELVAKTIANKTEFRKHFQIMQGVYAKDGKVLYTQDLLELEGLAFDSGQLISTESGEIVDNSVEYFAAAVVDSNNVVVPGVFVDVDRPDTITIKPEVLE